MGLTTRDLQCPHIFSVYDSNGNKLRDCGKESSALNYVQQYPGTTYKKTYLRVPVTVDISSVTIEEMQLPEQKILPKSQQEPLNL